MDYPPLAAALPGIFTEVIKAVPEILGKIAEEAGEISGRLGAVFQSAADIIMSVIEVISEFWARHGETIKAAAIEVFGALADIIDGAMKAIKGVIDVVMGLITGDWDRVWNGLKNIVKGAFEAVSSLIANALKACVAILTGAGKAFLSVGGSLFEYLWDGVKGVWERIKGWIAEKVEWLKDKLMFWKSGKEEMEGEPKPKPSGSHAAGLRYVPFDGYKAELHRGEGVLSAERNKEYAEGRAASGKGGDTYNFYSPKPISAYEAARQMRKAREALLLGF
jgi:uncharacterized protein YjbJ (UPF0337 family)